MMILNKRIKREVKNNIFRYGALLVMLILSISIVTGMAAASDSTLNTVKYNNENKHVESGEFSLFVPLSYKDKKILKNKGVKVEDNFYIDFNLHDESTLRIFKTRKEINLISLDSGRIAKTENEIVIEKHYAEKHNYKINSKVVIGKKVYTVTGIGSVPDYNMVIANTSDVSSNIEQFSVAFLSESGYKKLKDTGRGKTSEQYCYSYILTGKMTDNGLKHYLSKMDFDKTKITDKYMKQIIDKAEKSKNNIINGVNNLSDGSGKVTDGSAGVKDGSQKLYNKEVTLGEEIGKLNKGMGAFSDSAGKLKEYINNVQKGTSTALSGSKQLSDGLGNIKNNNSSLIGSAQEIFNGMISEANQQLNAQTGKTINLNASNYAETLDTLCNNSHNPSMCASIQQVKQKLISYQTFLNGLKQYTDSVSNAYNGSVSLSNGISQLYNGTQGLNEGASKLYNGSDALKNGSKSLYDGALKLADGSNGLYEGASKVSDGNKSLNNGIKDFQKSQTEFVNKNMNYHYENLTSFIAYKDNARIHAYKDFAKICKMTSIFVGVIFMILIAYIISVFIAHNIEKESTVIGTLYSLGYVKKELISHFLILPVVVSALGGIIGTIVGFYLINPMSIQNVSYFSYPNIQKYFLPYIIAYGIILPPVIAAIVNFWVLNRKLSREPLKLLRKEKKQNKISNINIRNIGFINSYRIRNQLREMRGNVILFLGIFISILLMVFSLSIYGSITSLISHTSNDVKYNYMYVLKYPPDKIPKGAQACYTEPLHIYYDLLGSDLEVDIQGINSKNPYYNFKVKCSKNEVYISDSVAEKFGYKKGDKITLKDDLDDKYYTFSVANIVKCSNGLYLFMDINNMRSVFGKENNYYNTLLSSHKLNIDSGRVLSSTTHNEIVKSVSLFIDNMFVIIVMMICVSIVVAILVMYLLIKMMIDKVTSSISLIKIFGYNEQEIRKIYLNSSIYIVLVSIIVSLPISRAIVYKIYPYIVSDVAQGMPAYISPVSCVVVVLTILVSYIFVNIMLSHNLKKISLAEALKDRE